MQTVVRSEELKTSQFLLDFLFEQDTKNWNKAVKDAREKIKSPKSIEEYITSNGQAKVQVSASATNFCLRNLDYADSYKILFQEMIDCASEINDRSGELANAMFRLHKNLEQLSDLNKMIKCQSQHDLFLWLSKMATGTGNFVASTGQLVGDYMGEDYMKTHFEEADIFKEFFNYREAIRTQYLK